MTTTGILRPTAAHDVGHCLLWTEKSLRHERPQAALEVSELAVAVIGLNGVAPAQAADCRIVVVPLC